MTHWHVANGLAGYGPDASDTDGYATAETMPDVADLVRCELDAWAEMADTYARSLAKERDFEQAWAELMRAESLTDLRRNLDNARADAPMFAGKPGLWADAIRRTVDQAFPLDVAEHHRLYVWKCIDPECESYAEYTEANG